MSDYLAVVKAVENRTRTEEQTFTSKDENLCFILTTTVLRPGSLSPDVKVQTVRLRVTASKSSLTHPGATPSHQAAPKPKQP